MRSGKLEIQQRHRADGQQCRTHFVQQKLPCRNGCTVEHALSDGEDYELLFTVAPEKVDLLYKLWNFDVPLSCIGKITEDKGLIYTLNGKAIDNLEITGYEHFNA